MWRWNYAGLRLLADSVLEAMLRRVDDSQSWRRFNRLVLTAVTLINTLSSLLTVAVG